MCLLAVNLTGDNDDDHNGVDQDDNHKDDHDDGLSGQYGHCQLAGQMSLLAVI